MKNFAVLRKDIFRSARRTQSPANIGFLSPQAFLPDSLAKGLVKKVYSLDTREKVDEEVKGTGLAGHGQSVYDVCVELRKAFEAIRVAKKAAKGVGDAIAGQDDESEGEDNEN